jgi:hypothetical protein
MTTTELQKHRDRYRPIAVQSDLAEGLREVREKVENQGKPKIILVGNSYKSTMLDDVQIVNYPPWEIGYKVEPLDIHQGFFKRTVFIKLKGDKILDVPEREMEPIMGAVTQELFDIGNEMPNMDLIADDCIRFTQRFAIMFWHEGNPNLVVPGGPK